MQKISSITATATPDGLFTNGSVASGVSPTILDAKWFNTIQNELVGVVEGAGLTLDPTNDGQVLAAIKSMLSGQSGGRLIGVQVFPASGTYTPTAGTKFQIVEALGGGAGGGGCSTPGSSLYTAAAGGNAGTYGKAKLVITAATTITIGAAGKGGSGSTSATGASVGGKGGDTSVGSLLVCPGGNSGLASNSFASNTYCQSILLLSPAATGANLFNQQGEAGGNGFILGTTPKSGDGGSSLMGRGGKGFFGTITATVGNNATGYGAGGGGASAASNGTGTAGGDGTPGIVIIWEYA